MIALDLARQIGLRSTSHESSDCSADGFRRRWSLLEMEASGTFCYTHSSQVYINPCSFPSIDTSLPTKLTREIFHAGWIWSALPIALEPRGLGNKRGWELPSARQIGPELIFQFILIVVWWVFAEGRKLAQLFEPAEFWRVLPIAPPPSVWATKRWLHLNQHGWKVYNYPSKASDYRRGRWSWWAEFQKFEHFCLWLHHQQPERQMEVASGINVLEKSRNTLPMSSDYTWW